MKLYTFTVAESARGSRLFPYACRMLPQVPVYALREAFQKRDVKVDGRRVDMAALAAPGAQVHIYARDTREKAIPIAYEDENLLVAVKPAGISCDADPKGGKTLAELLCRQLRARDARAGEPLLCHRLDNPTEGLILVAKTPLVKQTVQDAFRAGRIQKEYTCLVRGTPVPGHDVLYAWLRKDALHARVRVLGHEAEGAKHIVTEYDVLKAGECARLRIRLHTGRTHQIRAQMAFIGHPLLGDDQYGDREFNKRMKARRLMLCATSLTLEAGGALAYLNGRTFMVKPSF